MLEMLKSSCRNQKKLSVFLAYVSYCLFLYGNHFHKYDSTYWLYGNIHAPNNYLRQCIVKCVVNKKERKKSRNTWKKSPICFWNPVDQSPSWWPAACSTTSTTTRSQVLPSSWQPAAWSSRPPASSSSTSPTTRRQLLPPSWRPEVCPPSTPHTSPLATPPCIVPIHKLTHWSKVRNHDRQEGVGGRGRNLLKFGHC